MHQHCRANVLSARAGRRAHSPDARARVVHARITKNQRMQHLQWLAQERPVTHQPHLFNSSIAISHVRRRRIMAIALYAHTPRCIDDRTSPIADVVCTPIYVMAQCRSGRALPVPCCTSPLRGCLLTSSPQTRLSPAPRPTSTSHAPRSAGCVPSPLTWAQACATMKPVASTVTA